MPVLDLYLDENNLLNTFIEFPEGITCAPSSHFGETYMAHHTYYGLLQETCIKLIKYQFKFALSAASISALLSLTRLNLFNLLLINFWPQASEWHSSKVFKRGQEN